MSKNKNKRKNITVVSPPSKRVKSSTTPAGTVTPPPDNDSSEPKTIESIDLHPDDVDIAVDVLTTLAAQPSVGKSKALKELRKAVHEFRSSCAVGLSTITADTNLTAKVSAAIADGEYTYARIMLAEMAIRLQTAKLGALCRWVRDLDVVSGMAEQLNGTIPRTPREEQSLSVLDAILRLTGPIDYAAINATTMTGPIIPREPWDLRGDRVRRKTYDMFRRGENTANVNVQAFKVIETTPGAQRQPPNAHPAVVYTSADDAILLGDASPKTTFHHHAVVPNLHLIKDVLTHVECENIISAAEAIGFTPDAPLRDVGEENSILAMNFYWVVDKAFCQKLWSRVAPFVPAHVQGKQVRGLNRRFRVYRYVPNAAYRAHIDGAWPPSGVSEEGKYVYDDSPASGKQLSLFTFLIYLNDEFEAGETTFFLPSAKVGSLNAYPVKPIQGAIALFPHGETEGSLLHEGTGVRAESVPSAKYVIRTDVLYDVEPGR